MIRSHRAAAIMIVLGAVVLSGCGGENLFTTTTLSEDDRFRAESIIVESEDGALVDLVAEGATFDLIMDPADAAFESSFDHRVTHVDIQGEFTATDTEIVFSDDPFLADDVVTQRTFELEDDDDVLVLTDPSASFDLDQDGFPDPVEFRVVLVRR